MMHSPPIEILASMVPMAAALAVCVALEMVNARTHIAWRSRRLGSALTILTPGLAAIFSIPLRKIWQSFDAPFLISLEGVPWLGRMLLLLLLYDFLRYCEHRFEHRFWWPVHGVHHSPTSLHAANAYSHPLISVPEFFLIVLPLSLIEAGGIPIVVATIATFQNLFIHSPLKLHLGPLRRVIVDNRYHRIHHSLEPRHFGRNYGFVFTLWDQVFRTAYFPENDEWPDTGVASLPPPGSIGQYLLHPLRHFGGPLDVPAGVDR